MIRSFVITLFFYIGVIQPSHAISPTIHSSELAIDLATQRVIDERSAHKLPKKGMSNEALHRQANDLEAVLIAKMIEPMFPEGRESALFGGGHGNGIFRHLLIDEYGKILQRSGGLGIAENIVRDLQR